MNDALVLRQKSSEEGPDDPDNVLVLRQKSSEDRMILPDTPQRCGLPHHRHPLSPKTVVERGWRGYLFDQFPLALSSSSVRFLPPARLHGHPGTLKNAGFRSAIDSRSNTIRYGRKNHGSSTSSTPALRATTTTTKKNE